MLRTLIEVEDLTFEQIANQTYDVAMFASGYESRCIRLSQLLAPHRISQVVVWGFEGNALPEMRGLHDLHFIQKWARRPEVISHSQFRAPTDSLAAQVRDRMRSDRELHILCDYSSMSRTWYAALLNLARFTEGPATVTIDFAYTSGQYAASYAEEVQGAVVDEIVSIPGQEGLSATRDSTVAALGLGFSPAAAQGVLERIQPHSIFSFFADPGAKREYADVCRSANNALIRRSEFVLHLPLFSVSTTYRLLCEAVSTTLPDQQVSFIPMGPKPHVLASMLVACRFRQIACLYARMKRQEVSDVRPLDDLIITRACFSVRGPGKAASNPVRHAD